MTEYAKRSLDDAMKGGVVVAAKKFKADGSDSSLVVAGPKRTSFLQAPIMMLSGHQGEVLGCKFSPNGSNIASVSADKQIYLWRTYGDCENYMAIQAHKGSILDVHWFRDETKLLTASADKTCAMWDVEYGTRIKKFRGTKSYVNACHPSPSGNLVVAGGDDETTKIWDIRVKLPVNVLASRLAVTSVNFATEDKVFTGGIDNTIKCWDVRKNQIEYSMKGHTDTITGLAVSPDGNYILSNSMDNTVRTWDIRAFKLGDRLNKVFVGAQHNFEKTLLRCNWSHDGKYVAAGSSDRMVYVWNSQTAKQVYKLPGHAGSVNEVAFHPSEPIIVSASSDKRLYLGELDLL